MKEETLVNLLKDIGHEEPEKMNHLLLCHSPGLETRQRFIDLAVGLVVNFPGFKSPLPHYIETANATA